MNSLYKNKNPRNIEILRYAQDDRERAITRKSGKNVYAFMKGIMSIVAVILALTILTGTGCKNKTKNTPPLLEIVYTANQEGSILDLPCNSMGNDVTFYTIPQTAEVVKKIKADNDGKKIPSLVIDGGNSLFGVDDFSSAFNAEPVFALWGKAPYDLFFPGRHEYVHGLKGIKRPSETWPITFLMGNVVEGKQEKKEAPEVAMSKPGEWKVRYYNSARGDLEVAVFGWFDPKVSPLMTEKPEVYTEITIDKDIESLNKQISVSDAKLKILICRTDNLEGLLSKVKGVDLVIPGRFDDSLDPEKITEINGMKVLPWISSRYKGAARIGVHRKEDKFDFSLTFNKPEGPDQMPAALDEYNKKFRKIYGDNYEKVHTAFLGYGEKGLTHKMTKIQETPTSMLVADMIRNFAGTDLTIINMLSIRKPLKGIIRGEYVEWLLPYGNTLVTMDLTGEQIETLMQINGKHSSGFLVMSGAQIEYIDEGKKAKIYINGTPIDKKKVYRVATNDYLAKAEKPDYRIFKSGKNVHKTGIPINGIFLSHITYSPYLPVPPERIGKMSADELVNGGFDSGKRSNLFKWGFFNSIDSGPIGRIDPTFEVLTSSDDNILTNIAVMKIKVLLLCNLSGTSLEDKELLPIKGQSFELFEGRQLYKSGKVNEARKIWQKLSKEHPDDIPLRRLAEAAGEGQVDKAAGSPLWPKFKFDVKNSGRSPYKFPGGKEVSVKWKYKTFHSIKSSPAIGHDGTIYFGGGDGFFYALEPDGKLKWKYTVGVKVFILSSPAVAKDGTVYFGAAPTGGAVQRQSFKAGNPDEKEKGTGFLYALNPDGSEKWKFKTEGLVRSSPAIDSDGNIYFGCNDGFLYCVTSEGKVKWKFALGGKTMSSPAIADDGTVYIGAEDFHFYAVSKEGKEKWKFKAENKFFSSPSIDDKGKVYIGNDDDNLYAFNPEGKLLWKKKFPAAVTSTISTDKEGFLYAGCEDGSLLKLTSEGEELWKFKARDELFSSPIIDPEGKILIGCEDNNLYALSPDGKMLWKFETGDYLESTPIIAPDGTIYLSAEDNFFYALEVKEEKGTQDK